MSLQQIIADLTAAADELQAEIDRMIDEHGAIGRALAELRGSIKHRKPAPVFAADTAGITPAPAAPATPSVASDNGRPPDAAQPSAFTKRAKVLACTEGECEFECPIDKGHVLNNHTHTVHGRRPHTHERLPVDAAVTASAA